MRSGSAEGVWQDSAVMIDGGHEDGVPVVKEISSDSLVSALHCVGSMKSMAWHIRL